MNKLSTSPKEEIVQPLLIKDCLHKRMQVGTPTRKKDLLRIKMFLIKKLVLDLKTTNKSSRVINKLKLKDQTRIIHIKTFQDPNTRTVFILTFIKIYKKSNKNLDIPTVHTLISINQVTKEVQMKIFYHQAILSIMN